MLGDPVAISRMSTDPASKISLPYDDGYSLQRFYSTTGRRKPKGFGDSAFRNLVMNLSSLWSWYCDWGPLTSSKSGWASRLRSREHWHVWSHYNPQSTVKLTASLSPKAPPIYISHLRSTQS